MPETEVRTIEVHNVWAIYGLNPDGTESEQKLAMHARPQEWGDPRWSYHRYRFEWELDGTRYVNHFHGWTDLKREPHEYPVLFAPLLVQVLMPGSQPELCGRDYLGEEDFWDRGWGKLPPVFESSEPEEVDL